MGRRYADEVAELSATYAAVLRGAVSAPATDPWDEGPGIFVGSGGAMACARFAADLHQSKFGPVSAAMTPGALVATASTTAAQVTFFSARARHRDLQIAAKAVRRTAKRLVLVTQLQPDELPGQLGSLFDTIVTVPRLARDGFLATNSLLAMTSGYALLRGEALPAALPALEAPPGAQWPGARPRVFVLHAPEHGAVGVDLEARFNETGIGSAQVADFRNFAHGRHVALANNASDSVVLSATGPESADLCRRTLNLLAPSAHIPLRTELSGPAGTLDLLAAGMRTFLLAGRAVGSDPGRPRVSPEGRKLYHLSWTGPTARPLARPERLKLQAHGAGLDGREVSTARRAWERAARSSHVAAVVMDYDGTCVTTEDRLKPPPTPLQEQIVRLLTAGLKIGFASGRGRSLPDSLTTWIPAAYNSQVWIATYNGGVITQLGQPMPDVTACPGPLEEFATRIKHELRHPSWQVTSRRTQVTVETRDLRADLRNTGRLLAELAAREQEMSLKVVTSGHSLDVVPREVSKLLLLPAMETCANQVLAVGDQGQHGGNDFELLAGIPLSLSVDRVSGDLMRCWNLSRHQMPGPAVLTSYLRWLRAEGGVAHLELTAS